MKRIVSVSFLFLFLLSTAFLTRLTFNIQAVRAETEVWTVDDNESADLSTIQEAIDATNLRDTFQVVRGIYYKHRIVNKTLPLLGKNPITNFSVSSDIEPTIKVPDDYYTIQEAIDAAEAGETFFIRSGTYFEKIIIDKPISLIGESNENTIIVGSKEPPASRTGDVVFISSNNVKMSGVTVKNSGTYIDDAGIELKGSKNCSISNCIVMESNHGIYLDLSSNNTIENNTLSAFWGYGIFLWSSISNNLISNKCSYGHTGIAIDASSHNNMVENNTIHSNRHCGITMHTSNYNFIFNNTSSKNGNQGIKLSSCSNNTITNNTSNLNHDVGFFLKSSNDNILMNNTCNSNNHIGINLRQSSNSNRIEKNTCNSNKANGIFLFSSCNNNVLVKNRASDNGWGGIYLHRSCDNNTIRDNVCNSNDKYGIKLHDSERNMIKNNWCSEEGGIWIGHSSNNVLDNNTIISAGIGLHISCNNNLIINNTVLKGGISLRSSNNNRVTNNLFSKNGQFGVFMDSSNHNTFENNTCASNGEGGMTLRDSSHNWIVNNTLWDNDCSNEHGPGVCLLNSSYTKVSHNTISMNGVGLYITEDCKRDRINWNNIEGNTWQGIDSKASMEVNASHNWWGDSSGPFHPTLNPNGKGDEVKGNVLFKSWLDAPVTRITGPSLKVSDLSTTPTQVKVGESTHILVNITNTGDITGEFTVNLKINGSIEETKELTLAGGKSSTVTFEVAEDVAGTYVAEIDGLTGIFVVEEERAILYEELLRDYNDLQSSHNQLNSSYTALQDSYDRLQSDKEAIINELSTIRNLMYVFIAATLIFIATTVYFAKRKPETKQKK